MSTWQQRIFLPGLPGVPVLSVLRYLVRRLPDQSLGLRASSIAYHFFLALFPGLIFLFSLIPYLPLHELRDELHALLSYLPGAPPPQPDATVREELLNLLERGLPGDAFLLIRDTVHNLLTQKRGGLLSFGVGASIFFAANGLYGLMQAFNEEDTRHFVVRRLLSVGLTVGLGILVLVALSLLIAGRFILDFLFELGFIHDMVTYLGLMAFRLVSAMAVLFLVIGVLQYYTASPGTRLRVFSPGAFLSTVLILLTSWGFSWYVENFAQYSKFYGSLGTPVIIMLWIYLNAYALLVGYEFNASVVIFRRELQRGGNTESAEARLEERLAP